jgi:hypothetical protein
MGEWGDGNQLRRDTTHARELRNLGQPVSEALGTEVFEAALQSGLALDTTEAIPLGLGQKESTMSSAQGRGQCRG